ncbi:Hypothetical protein CCH01_015910 [Clostridium chauvoei JF4335]|nr:Hypothetical protein CCH01_015910 [Clostridium chauvoei JF4335]
MDIVKEINIEGYRGFKCFKCNSIIDINNKEIKFNY